MMKLFFDVGYILSHVQCILVKPNGSRYRYQFQMQLILTLLVEVPGGTWGYMIANTNLYEAC